MSKSVLVAVLLFVAGVIVGRGSVLLTQPEATAPSSSPTPSVSAPSAPMMPTEAKRGGLLRGRVAEVIQVSQYTYLRLESGEWAAVPSAPGVAVGQSVGLMLQNEMTNFTSPSLGRTFASVWFGALEGAEPVARTADVAPMAPMMAPPRSDVKAALQAVEASSAPTMRVVDLYSERALLAGRHVKVKGTVDRSTFVQGVHYVYLKDGTGSPAQKTDELLCLTAVELTKGQAVTMEGVVAVDKDRGMGVVPVTLEAAKAL